MKLSDSTVEILKNFASINMNLLIKPGNVLKTCSSTKNSYAEATIEETFEKEIGIYDLNKFLALMSMKSGSPDIEIEEAAFAFKGAGKGKIRMRFSEPRILIVPPEKFTEPEFEASFTITQETLNWINNAASILKAPHLIVKCEGADNPIILTASDATGAMTDDASVTLEDYSAYEFTAVIDLAMMNLIPGSYDVKLSSSGMISAANKNRKLKYWIALTADDNKKIIKSVFEGKPMRRKSK